MPVAIFLYQQRRRREEILPKLVKTVLTIAGSDSCSGAGVQADLRTILAFGAYGVCAVTALTAQNTSGVHHVYNIPGEFVARQIDAAAEDFDVVAVKSGMLLNTDVVDAVAVRIKRFGFDRFVVDPVFVSKNGRSLLCGEAVKTAVTNLFPLSFLVTPNIPEAELIVGRGINNIGDMKAAASALKRLGPANVLIKGGHLAGHAGMRRKVVDILYDGKSFTSFEGDFLADKNVHGTGCVYSAAIAAELANGRDLAAAVGSAREFIGNGIADSLRLGKGAYAVMVR